MIRRSFLGLSAAALVSCGPTKGTRFPGYALVANRAGKFVTAVDLRTFSVAREIKVESAPAEILAHPSRPAAYALCPDTGLIAEIDGERLAVSRRARLGGPGVTMRLAPDGQSLWVLQPAALVQVPFGSLRPARRLAWSDAASDLDLSRTGRAAIVFGQTRRVGIADTGRGVMEHQFDAGVQPVVSRFRSDGKLLLTGDAAGRAVLLTDPDSGRTMVRLPLPLEPRRFCFGAAGGQLFISGPGMDAVSIVYPYWTEVAETILAGRAPGALAAIEAPGYLFVSNPQSGSVTVLDIDTRKLVAVVSVGEEPGPILFTPDGQYALVLNQRSGDVAVIRVPTLGGRRTKRAPLFTMIPVGPRPVSGAVVPV